MKVLRYILRRMSQQKLATTLGLTRANLTIWKANKAVPKKHAFKLKEIKNELAKKNY